MLDADDDGYVTVAIEARSQSKKQGVFEPLKWSTTAATVTC
jgi:hypothetical protein